MSLAVSSRPHSPTAIHSGDAIFLSIHCQLTSRTALGCTPQVFRIRISPMKSGIVVSHSSLKTALVTTASSPDITGEAWFTAKVPSRPSRVLFKLKRLLINSKWQCPSMATLLSISPSASPSSGAWRTCARASSVNSARSRIITRQWRTAATSHGEGVATFSTVPLQYAANCFPSISRLTDTVGSMLSSHPRSCTNRPKLSGDLPNLQAISSKIFFTDLHQVGSLSSVKFPSSTCFSQCLFERCSELHSAHSHFQQLNSGRKNHGRCIDSTCLRKRFFDTPQMTHRAAVRSPPLSFSSSALSSTATTLSSSSALSSTVTTLLSSCTFSTATTTFSSGSPITTWTSSEDLCTAALTASTRLLPSTSVLTQTRRATSDSWRGRFWGAVLLLGDLPCLDTLTPAGDSRRALLPSLLRRLGERLRRDLTRGIPVLTGDLLRGDLALLGDDPLHPSDCLLGALPVLSELHLWPLLGDLSLQLTDLIWPISLLAGLPTDGEARLPHRICRPRGGPPAERTAPLPCPWNLTSLSSTNLENRGSSSDDHYNENQKKTCVVVATSLRCKCNTRNVPTMTKSLLLCIHFSASAPNHYIHPDTLQERELGQRHCSLSPGDISQTQQGKADINGYGYIHYWPKTLHTNNHLYMYNTCPTIADPGISDILNCSWISITNSYPNTDLESSAAQLFPSPC